MLLLIVLDVVYRIRFFIIRFYAVNLAITYNKWCHSPAGVKLFKGKNVTSVYFRVQILPRTEQSPCSL